MNAGRSAAEINVAPLIDVLLVVLIIFMVSQPVIPAGLSALMPQPAKANAATPESTIVLEVDAAEAGGPTYAINQRPYAKDAVVGELSRVFATRSERTMFVKGDAGLTYREVAEAIDMGHQAGVTHIGLLTPGSAGAGEPGRQRP